MNTSHVVLREDGSYEISGLLTFATVPALLKQSSEWLTSGERVITVDLKLVSRADSAGLALMIEWSRLARARQLQLSFANIPTQLATLIRISGLQDLFPTESN